MDQIVGERSSEPSATLFLHFEVFEHALGLDTFIETADSTRRIVEALNESLFSGNLAFEIIVIPPQKGTFLTKLVLRIIKGAGFVFIAANTPIGSNFIEGLTGKSPEVWSNEFGEGIAELVAKVSPLDDEEEGLTYPLVLDEAEIFDNEELCISASSLVSSMAIGVLEKESYELKKLFKENDLLLDALDARADFYIACIENRNVKAVGFSSSGDFPIPRNIFPDRAQKPVRPQKSEDEPEWFVVIDAVYVTSPNWDKDDRFRQWKGRDQVGRDCFFTIEDEEFWRLVKRRELNPQVLDQLKIQWAFVLVAGRPKSRRVLRVLEFNQRKLADPLDDNAIAAILGRFTKMELSSEQNSLFD